MSEKKIELKNITGCLLIDARAAFLNGAGLGAGEDRNKVIPKTFKEKIDGRLEEVPYVSAQAWRRWLRDTTNEENGWNPSELQQIGTSEKGSTSKIATFLNPIEYGEDDLFGYMKSGSGTEESIQRTSPFKTSILKGLLGKRTMNNDEAFVHLKEGTPLPYSTRFYSTHLEGFFNLEYYRLGVYDNLGSRVELGNEIVEKFKDKLEVSELNKKFKRYTLTDSSSKKVRAAGLLKGISVLRGGAKQAAFGSDVAPKVLILAGLSSANPVFNDLFEGKGEKPNLKIGALKQIVGDYKNRLATPVYIGFREGYLGNESEITALKSEGFIIGTPISIVTDFTKNHLT
jgi:CRISPR-associated protein Cst2